MSNFKRYNVTENSHFSKALFSSPERSRMDCSTELLTSFNAGDIVPIYCREILPEEELTIDVNSVIRQTTLLTPTMGRMSVDIFAFWVPNRVVNASWKAVQGENYSGSWVAPQVSLAPLVGSSTGSVQIPVGSVADYYDFPTQMAIPKSVLSKCHDLKFRGYVSIYNEYFRDQNYQPPIPISYLNVYQGFLDPDGTNVGLTPGASPSPTYINNNTVPDGSVGDGAAAYALFGTARSAGNTTISPANGALHFRATQKPLKANKLHDYFTSVLPSPQKSQTSVVVPVQGITDGTLPVTTSSISYSGTDVPLRFSKLMGDFSGSNAYPLAAYSAGNGDGTACVSENEPLSGSVTAVYPSNLVVDSGIPLSGLNFDISDLRMSAALQQYYETLARGGSRYRTIISTLFGVDVEDPFDDVPQCLGKISRDLDLYQTAQTSSSESGSSPQGNLAGFGYTATGGHLFSTRFLEHGYVHIFAVVRHRNVYSSYLPRDNFRLTALDYYTPQLDNISEQPVYTREINPFGSDPDSVFGYQEAWAEYRFEPDRVTGFMRPQSTNVSSFALWNYADSFDSSLQISNANWLKSNSEEVLNRTLAVDSSVAPQFKASFVFKVDKTLPMSVYSVPGLDII
ncbi:major capsid protein [Sigmofec virus UA08Rod_5307]|uniref:Major capsid protein n=1 Tax=Sigmofec virus UA08Rod_5307 TaxID=2929418 RepID=A0A976N183_9VIRU|nr:major capsid protein [Sigmofec virus UA08Rod_5307]